MEPTDLIFLLLHSLSSHILKEGMFPSALYTFFYFNTFELNTFLAQCAKKSRSFALAYSLKMKNELLAYSRVL